MSNTATSINETTVMKAIALCHKEWLKPEEAQIYTNLKRTQLARKCEEYGIYKNRNGYYKRSELDKILSGAPTNIEEKTKGIKL
ncbi:hypothetical protein QTN47_17210 [Danxiaibacter flavus]|uniref:DNA-binding protein n=1 Tax=Danxiaibacter flavus TaxID=3049108 RepID=A0ABV3ZH78_9BACT|nr:hypothetical protein QNM32_17220 [Chitinophagaceae bacterium DXS]